MAHLKSSRSSTRSSSTSSPGSIGGEQQENDFLQELVSALEQCHERIQAMADAAPGSTDVGAVLTMAYMTWPRLYVISTRQSGG